MKTLLALLISCLTLSAATTYPVLTDSANRTFPGGVTNVFFLNSNVVTTGTMRATGVLTLTNSGNVFAGDGSGLTGISAGISKTNGSATNLSVYSSGTTNQPLRVWLGTQTNSNPAEISGVWNNAAVDFSAFKINVTNTASGSGSKIADFQVNGSSQAYVDKNGRIVANKLQVGSGAFSTVSSFPQFSDENTGEGYNTRGGIYAAAGFRVFWASAPNSYSGADSAIGRYSAGVVSVTDGAGSLRDLVARSIYATNLYATNLIINGGATVTKILSATASLNFDLTALTVEDLTITVTGAADGDVVTLGVPNGSVTTSVQFTAWVSAADTVTVRARTSAIGENPASGTFRATIFKH